MPNCGKPSKARGWCMQHYDAWRKRGDPAPSVPKTKNVCSIAGCNRDVHGNRYCHAHYCRWLKYGDPSAGRAVNGSPMRFFEETVLTYQGDDCLMWPFAVNHAGYGRIYIAGRMQIVSRVVCEEINGPALTTDHQAAHSCGNGHLGCVNPRHLRWATRIENESDKETHGTTRRGARHPMAILSESEVRNIYYDCRVQSVIASDYRVSQTTVSDIKRGKRWHHISSTLARDL